jgi:ABC-type antimicrobial peptide transport system permease subunit
VKTRDLMELAGRNLREAMLRNSLTTLGIAVGVASLVAMMSLGIGLQKLVMTRLEGSGLFNRVYVTPRPIGGSLSGRGGGRGGRGRNQQDDVPTPGLPPQLQPPVKPLTSTVRKQLAQMPNVVSVFPELRFTADLRYGGTGHVTSASSVPFDAKGTGQFDNITGSFFSGPNANEAILHTDLAQQLADQGNFKPNDLVGQEVTIRYPERKPVAAPPNQSPQDIVANGEFGPGFTIQSADVKVKIVGLVGGESAGPGGFGGSRIMLPLELVERLNAVQGFDVREVVANPGETIYPSLTMLIDNPNHVQAVEDAVKLQGFGAFSLFDAARNLQKIFAVLDLFLLIFGSLALAVASLGIINTLVMAILERRHEIGILKALGAADRDVRQLFFTEAGAMGLAGGVFGVFLGWAIGQLINFAMNKYLASQNLSPEKIWLVPLWLVGAAIVFSIGVSLVAGLYPASRAAKLDPVRALRYE